MKVNDVTRGFVYAISLHVCQQSVRATFFNKIYLKMFIQSLIIFIHNIITLWLYTEQKYNKVDQYNNPHHYVGTYFF